MRPEPGWDEAGKIPVFSPGLGLYLASGFSHYCNRHPGPKSWTKPQSTSSTCAGKTTRTSRTSTTSSGRTRCWSSKVVAEIWLEMGSGRV